MVSDERSARRWARPGRELLAQHQIAVVVRIALALFPAGLVLRVVHALPSGVAWTGPRIGKHPPASGRKLGKAPVNEMKTNDWVHVREPDVMVGRIIFALASSTRRRLLEQLADRDGQRLKELCENFDITRQAIMKHIEVLAGCGLVTVKRFAHETRVFLNRRPIRLLQRAFFDQFA